MKVILLKDVANLGKKFAVVNVPDGYAQNKLIPKNQALLATPENVKRLTQARDVSTKQKGARVDEFVTAIKALEGEVVTVHAAMNEQGHLFETLKPAAVVEALAPLGVRVAPEAVKILESVKHGGEQKITLVFEGAEVALDISIVSK